MKFALFILTVCVLSAQGSQLTVDSQEWYAEKADQCKKIDFYEDCVRDSRCEWDRINESCVTKPTAPESLEN